MSAVDPNLSPVIVIPAGGGASLPVTAADDLLDGASPDRFFTTADDGRGQLSTPAASRTLMRATTTIPGASFTATAGLGTATASTLTMTTAVQASTWSNVPRLLYDHGGDPWNVSVTATLATLTGGDGNTFVPLALRNSAGGLLILAQVRGSDGQVTVYDSGLLATSGTVLPVNGTGQLRIVLRDGRPTVYQSEDSGANWRPIYAGAMAFPSASPWAYTRVSFNLYQGTAPGGTVTVQWADVTVGATL